MRDFRESQTQRRVNAFLCIRTISPPSPLRADHRCRFLRSQHGVGGMALRHYLYSPTTNVRIKFLKEIKLQNKNRGGGGGKKTNSPKTCGTKSPTTIYSKKVFDILKNLAFSVNKTIYNTTDRKHFVLLLLCYAAMISCRISSVCQTVA